jgi:hydrogenase nickel incorporation protein HypA/HybF
VHELAITESLVSTVRERIGDDAKVRRVRLIVGKLSGVVPDALMFCFDVCAKGTPLEGALLEIDEIAARARCRECDQETVIEDAIPLCRCGSPDIALLSGQELRIKEVEVI